MGSSGKDHLAFRSAGASVIHVESEPMKG